LEAELTVESDRYAAIVSQLKRTQFDYIVEQIKKVLSVKSPASDDNRLENSVRLSLLRVKIEETLQSGIFLDKPPRAHWDEIQSQLQTIIAMMPVGPRDSLPDTLLVLSFISGPTDDVPSSRQASSNNELEETSTQLSGWHPNKFFDCIRKVSELMTLAYKESTGNMQKRNALVLKMKNWMDASSDDGCVALTMELENGKGTGSAKSFQDLANLCADLLDSKAKVAATMTHVFSRLPDDSKQHLRGHAGVLRKGLEYIEKTAEFMAMSESVDPSASDRAPSPLVRSSVMGSFATASSAGSTSTATKVDVQYALDMYKRELMLLDPK
jgi:hypothetical protein